MVRTLVRVFLITALVGAAIGCTIGTATVVAVEKFSSVVRVQIPGTHGSGVHIGDGYILTAAHVVGDSTEITIQTEDGQEVRAAVMWVNAGYDLALLRVGMQTADGQPLRLGSAQLACRAARPGEEVTAVGNPWQFKFLRFHGRVVGATDQHFDWHVVILIDVTAGPGMSGGPVYDSNGRVIAFVVGMPNGPMMYRTGVLAVPASAACELLARPSDGASA